MNKDFGFEIVSDKELALCGFIAEEIILPERKTKGSAGYDICSPYSEIKVDIEPNYTIILDTGIKCKVPDGYVLKIYPRSSMGIKKGIVLSNTVGIIDADYYGNEDNDGHIRVALRNLGNEKVTITHREAIAQAILEKYYTFGDEVNTKRVGGIGSTNKGE